MGLVSLLKEEYTQLAADMSQLSHLDKTVQKLDQVIVDLNIILEKKAQISLVRNELVLEEIFKYVRSGLVLYIKKAEADLEVNLSEAVRLYSFRVYIHSILYNLVSNAIKFRDPKRRLHIQLKSSIV
jgi:signal transduction histidine kinase